ncbi:MAG: hypothetical protein E7272_03255 [Pseudobutyrivibrio ruminis]|uniref:Transposase (putative) YhgA-like domain-containing protein n=1 Tax=Pseudobutyrivibrio ruminis TaxID=46206 RepID=A0A927YKR9_9FIRM|nr:hypothetical protein [Pseudobutyrivibrio ruminis]
MPAIIPPYLPDSSQNHITPARKPSPQHKTTSPQSPKSHHPNKKRHRYRCGALPLFTCKIKKVYTSYKNINSKLLPFYLFTKEKELPQIELDSAQADALIQEYEVMLTRLDKLVENNILSAFSRGVIIKLIKEVNEKLTNKYVNINRRVGDYMGGRVLDLDIIRAHDSGIAEGREEGRQENAVSNIRNLMKNMKLTAEQAMEALGIDKSEFSKYMTML